MVPAAGQGSSTMVGPVARESVDCPTTPTSLQAVADSGHANSNDPSRQCGKRHSLSPCALCLFQSFCTAVTAGCFLMSHVGRIPPPASGPAHEQNLIPLCAHSPSPHDRIVILKTAPLSRIHEYRASYSSEDPHTWQNAELHIARTMARRCSK